MIINPSTMITLIIKRSRQAQQYDSLRSLHLHEHESSISGITDIRSSGRSREHASLCSSHHSEALNIAHGDSKVCVPGHPHLVPFEQSYYHPLHTFSCSFNSARIIQTDPTSTSSRLDHSSSPLLESAVRSDCFLKAASSTARAQTLVCVWRSAALMLLNLTRFACNNECQPGHSRVSTPPPPQKGYMDLDPACQCTYKLHSGSHTNFCLQKGPRYSC